VAREVTCICGGLCRLMFPPRKTALISAVVLIGAVGHGAVLSGSRRARRREGEFGDTILSSPGRPAEPAEACPAIGLFLVVNLLFYTSFFEHWQGIDAFKTLASGRRRDRAHIGPCMRTSTGFGRKLPLCCSWSRRRPALGSRRPVRRVRRALGLASSGLLGYSYKTPWLALNMIAPLAVTALYVRVLCGAVARCRVASWPRLRPFSPACDIPNGRADLRAVHNGRIRTCTSTPSGCPDAGMREFERSSAQPRSPIAITSEDHFPLSCTSRRTRSGTTPPVVTGDPL